MIVSLNEIEARALKAARGAGLAWGLAEEAGMAARFLAAHGVDATISLAALLAEEPRTSAPLVGGTTLRPRDADGWLCPIRVGAFLSDLGCREAVVERVLHPLWLAPFLARGAHEPRRLTWPSAAIHVWATAIAWSDADDVGAPDVTRATIAVAEGAPDPRLWRRASLGGVAVDDAAWAALGVFEALTYVPESCATRLSGAGTGALTDND